MAFVTTAALPRIGLVQGTTAVCPRHANTTSVVAAPMEIRAAKHAQFKAAKKADRCRPKKRRPSDKYRKAPPFNPSPLLDQSLPPVMTIIPHGTEEFELEAAGIATLVAPAPGGTTEAAQPSESTVSAESE